MTDATKDAAYLAEVARKLKDEKLCVWVLKTMTRHGDYIELFRSEEGARTECLRWFDDEVSQRDEPSYDLIAQRADFVAGRSSIRINDDTYAYVELQEVKP